MDVCKGGQKTITNLLIKYKVHYIVILLTALYWGLGLTARFYPSIFLVGHSQRFIHEKLIYFSIIINIISIILLLILLYFKARNLKYTLILLCINILAVFIGKYFISYPIMLM